MDSSEPENTMIRMANKTMATVEAIRTAAWLKPVSTSFSEGGRCLSRYISLVSVGMRAQL